MGKLRHIAMSVDDPEKTADFYCEAFDMVGKSMHFLSCDLN